MKTIRIISLFIFMTFTYNFAQQMKEKTHVPAWAKEAIWYQIFPERFNNGDKSNDPKPEDLKGAWPYFVPEGWQIHPWTSDWYKLQPWEVKTGKDFYWKDPYCQNLFAKGFEHQEGVGGSYELLTSFEVLEHSMDPVKDMEKMLSFAPNVLLTTECVPVSCPRPGEWWYYGLAHGQHIALFSKRSLEVLADRMGMRFYSRSSIHLLTKKKISNVSFHLACMISRYIS